MRTLRQWPSLLPMYLPGVKTQSALGGRNLTDNTSNAYSVSRTFLGTATFERARSYGVDVSVDF